MIPCGHISSRESDPVSYLDLVFYNSREKENRLLISDLSAIAGCFSFLIFKTEIKIKVVELSFVQ